MIKINYKDEYKSAYDFTKMRLKNMSYKDKRQYVNTRMKSKKDADLIDWKGNHFWKKIVANAQYHAIKDHQKEFHKKGISIYGKPIRR